MKIQAQNCMIDWLEFSIFNLDECQVLHSLGVDNFKFEVKKGFYYSRVLNFDNMICISSEYKGAGGREHVHVKITGKGCRFLEDIFETKDLKTAIRKRLETDWFDTFFVDEIDIKVSRMDIAIDYNFKFVIDMFESVLNESVKGVKSFQHTGSLKSGLTLYLGSRNSDKFFRLYEKDFEQKDFVNYKDRVELVLKNEYATFEFNSQNELIKIASTYMSELEFHDAERQRLWTDMQNGYCDISPKIRHKKTTLKEKADYILNTYGGTLKAYAEEYGTKDITAAIHESILSEKEIRLINNERVIKLMKYKKQAKKRSSELKVDYNNKVVEVTASADSLYESLVNDEFTENKQLRIC